MKRRIFSLLLAALMMLAILSGCANWDEETYSNDPLGELSKYYQTDIEEEIPALTSFSLP